MNARLALTGRPRLIAEDGREIALPRKAHVIAAALLLDHTNFTASRRDLGKLLWERCEFKRRAANLRQLLNRIKVLQDKEGIAVFAIKVDRVTLLHDRLEIDLVMLHSSWSDWGDRRLVDLCRAYGGDLLDGGDGAGVAYTRWLWAHRAALRHRFVSLVSDNLEVASSVLDADEILICAKRLLAVDPLNEVAQRCLLRLHAARGEARSVTRIQQRLDGLMRRQGKAPIARETSSSATSPRPAINLPENERAAPTASPLGVSVRHSLPRLVVRMVTTGTHANDLLDHFRTFLDDAIIGFWRSGMVTVLRVSSDEPMAAAMLSSDPCDFLFDCRISHFEAISSFTSSLCAVETGEIMWIQRYGPHDVDLAAVMDLVRCCLRRIEDALLLESTSRSSSSCQLIATAARLLKSTDLKAVRRARGLLRSVLHDDPDDVRAMALMSRARRLEWLLLARPDSDLLCEAIGIARSAVLTEPDAATALQQFGVGNIYARNHEVGLQALFRAHHLAPYDYEIIGDLADGLINAGRLEEGLDLLYPLLGVTEVVNDQMLWNAASGLYLGGRYEEALAIIARLSCDEPASQLAAACHAMIDRRDNALRLVQRTYESIPHFDVAGRLLMAPLRRKEDFEHYAEGLRRAGFE